MHYFLNGGRDERSVVKSAAAQAMYQQLGIRRLLFIPFAIVEDYWQERWHTQPDLFAMPSYEVQALTTLDTDPRLIQQKIVWAEAIYFPGGAQASLLKRAKASGITELIQQAIAARSLKLLAGGSAGAMVLGADCIVGHSQVNAVVPGLNFLPGYVVDSHFSNRHREPRLQQIMRQRPDLIGMGIDEDTGVVLNEDFALQAVYGPGTVKVYYHANTEIYDSNSCFTP